MKILKKIFLLLILFFPLITFASTFQVRKVYNDISKDYIYYDELQTFYDKGMFLPDADRNFNPNRLISREEFVGVMSEINCNRCIKPDVEYDFIKKYSSSDLFFDVSKENFYFYCIAGALDKKQIKGYNIGTKCQNGISQKGENPFCPKNTIILEEALAILLRASNILKNEEAEKFRLEILNGKKFPALSEDIFPTLSDGSVYSFYPDFAKALDYKITEYNTNGDKKIYNLIEKDSNKLNPKKEISRQDFLKMAYILLKGNSCFDGNNFNVGLEIEILEENCSKNNYETCNLSDLKGKKFDFIAKTGLKKGDKITDENNYIWRFYNIQTGKETVKYGKYLDNFKFEEDGKYRIYLSVKTDSGNFGEVFNDFNIGKDKNFKISINSSTVKVDRGENIILNGIVSDKKNIKSYLWDFGDSQTTYGKNTNHIYKDYGVYKAKFDVIYGDGNISSSDVLIYINDENNNSGNGDFDGDGIFDNKDECINIFGVKENDGCPIFEKTCEKNEDCKNGEVCINGVCKKKDFAKNCEYSGGNLFYGNIVCDNCPCVYDVDFKSQIRTCDVIFPAITSPDETELYSKGKFYKIKK